MIKKEIKSIINKQYCINRDTFIKQQRVNAILKVFEKNELYKYKKYNNKSQGFTFET